MIKCLFTYVLHLAIFSTLEVVEVCFFLIQLSSLDAGTLRKLTRDYALKIIHLFDLTNTFYDLFRLTLQSSKSRIACLLKFKVKKVSLGDVILLTSQGVSITEVQEGLKFC